MDRYNKDAYDALVERAIWEVEQAEDHLMRLITRTDSGHSHTARQGGGWYLFDPGNNPGLKGAADWLVRTGRGVRDSSGVGVWVHTGPGLRAGAVEALENMLVEVIACTAPLVHCAEGIITVRSGKSPAVARAMRWLAARGWVRIVRQGTDGSLTVSMPDPVLGSEKKRA